MFFPNMNLQFFKYIQKMPVKIYTCQVLYYEKTAYYNSVESPEKLSRFLEANRNWKYLNVYDVDKTKENRCGNYLRRIYSQKYLIQKENEKKK